MGFYLIEGTIHGIILRLGWVRGMDHTVCWGRWEEKLCDVRSGCYETGGVLVRKREVGVDEKEESGKQSWKGDYCGIRSRMSFEDNKKM